MAGLMTRFVCKPVVLKDDPNQHGYYQAECTRQLEELYDKFAFVHLVGFALVAPGTMWNLWECRYEQGRDPALGSEESAMKPVDFKAESEPTFRRPNIIKGGS